jgi:His/Glu/Gln/Arg/opine family amino acid ABC transporter permease subunit
LLQATFVGIIAAALFTVTFVAVNEMQRKGITSGFSFLWRSTGWDVGFSLLSYSIRDPYWWALLIGLLNTVVVGYTAILAASLLGLGVAIGRMSKDAILRGISTIYVDVVRNVPPILQVFIWYAVFTSLPRPRDAIVLLGSIYLSGRSIAIPTIAVYPGAKFAAACILLSAAALLFWLLFSKRAPAWSLGIKALTLTGTCFSALVVVGALFSISRLPSAPFLDFPRLQGFGLAGGSQFPPEASAIFFAIMVYGSAYIAEVVRAGFMAIPGGQPEAGRALGLSDWQIFRKIQLPLAFRYMLPALANQYIWLIKATTLGVAVGFADLFLVVSSAINQIGQPIELMGILIGVFWCMSHATAWASNKLNESLKLKG